MLDFKTIQICYTEARKTMHPLDALNDVVHRMSDHHFSGRLEKILAIDTNHKTIKGQARGYMTGVIYLAPNEIIPGLNQCPMAKKAGCAADCLYYAGRGRYTRTQIARIRKTLLFYLEPEIFFGLLKLDILSLSLQAKMVDKDYAIRLNGTSDLLWESLNDPGTGKTLLQLFPSVQFYDYTKITNRRTPDNYHLTFSYSEASESFQKKAEKVARESQQNLAVVFDKKPFPEVFLGRRVIDGDKDDLRFLDPLGVIVGLTAKGPARKGKSGFVIYSASGLAKIAA